MVVSSAEAAREMFKNNDLAFASHTTNEALRVDAFDKGSMTMGPYGPYWRIARRICTTELFTNNRVSQTEHLRAKCVDNMIRWIWAEAQEKGGIVEIARFVSLMNFNVIGNIALSKDIVDPKSREGIEFLTSVSRVLEYVVEPNLADFFPFVRWLDPQNMKRRMKPDMKVALDFAFGFVKERLQDRQKGKTNIKRDFLDAVLDFQGNKKDGEPSNLSSKQISTIIVIQPPPPSTMKRAQAELDQVVGPNRKVEESDIGKLPYLQSVVKETLRLYPSIPLLPRKAINDTQFMEYLIPKDTQILVNVWAIRRDPNSWDDPSSFKPERFLSSDIDFKGQARF
ncbi:hypothetical protein IFM89_001462 [Coptis chinensis]|uniref:Cytochrome P450 n=1 Tax=Coptis chinensis TaxID=261450 RepID=A0A835LCE7_9MAGN|nr:hypothetical protein IFM89_001462 [Coptis chinensis]